jgi:hypothetical protein
MEHALKELQLWVRRIHKLLGRHEWKQQFDMHWISNSGGGAVEKTLVFAQMHYSTWQVQHRCSTTYVQHSVNGAAYCPWDTS